MIETQYTVYAEDDGEMYVMNLRQVMKFLGHKLANILPDYHHYQNIIEDEKIKTYYVEAGEVPQSLGEMSLTEYFDTFEHDGYIIKK